MVRFSQAVHHCCQHQEVQRMPTTRPKPAKGQRVLKAVKDTAARELAARTELAINRLQSSSSVEVESIEPATAQVSIEPATAQVSIEPVTAQRVETAQRFTAPSSGELWQRQDFASGNLLLFSRGDGEALTIRRSPTGNGWVIDYEPTEERPL